MKYIKTPLTEEIVIKNIVTVHYFEHSKNYIYSGEKHNFWEFLYVDKGEVEVISNTDGFRLKQGEMIFHQPNEFHNVWANGKIAPNIIVISFDCKSIAMQFFQKRIVSIGEAEKNLIAQIIKEVPHFVLPSQHSFGLELCNNAQFASKQLVKIYLEQLLISLIRKNTQVHIESRISSIIKERSDKEIIQKLITFLTNNIDKQISFNELVIFSKTSSTHVKLLFKKETDMSAMEYYRMLKIDKAKHLIREENLSLTKISEQLGYDSIHYFSRQFKKITGMSPREYAHSVQAKI